MFVSGCVVLLWAPFRESRALDVASPDDDVYYYNVVAKGEGTVLGFRVQTFGRACKTENVLRK